jgi:hypothetical protein
MRDRSWDTVTINLYALETNDATRYNSFFRAEIANIKKIHHGLVNAANHSGRNPPNFVVSVLLVPLWDRANNSYQNNEYLDKKNQFIEELKASLNGISNMFVEDFYTDHVKRSDLQAYMHDLKALGNTTDIIKTVAVINNAKHCRHLQIDSNTVVPSYKDLYIKTFFASEQKDGINASYYDIFYISAHNKMIYTTPEGHIATKSRLENLFYKWCGDHKNDDNVIGDKKPQKNSIYSKVFTPALKEIEYTRELLLNDNNKVYPATLDDKVYWLTNCMVTAVNMSWSDDAPKTNPALLQIPSVKIGEDGIFNYQCLDNVIKKYTGNLKRHSKAIGLSDNSKFGDASRQLLLQLTNYKLELEATREFYKNAVQMMQTTPELIDHLIPNTDHGTKLTMELFGCTVSQMPDKIRMGTLFSPPAIETKPDQEDQVLQDTLSRSALR